TVLAEAHATIDHELTASPMELDSHEEKTFLDELSEKFGRSLYQLVECQRPFNTIVNDEKARSFYDQRVDFSLETKHTRIIMEIDGKQHQESIQKALDEKRDQFLRLNNWEVVRIPTSDI